MKRHFYLLVFLPTILFAQVDSLKELLNYYPLQTGNYWEYLSYSQQIPFPQSDSSCFSVEVTGDTILENGYTYKILLIEQIWPYHYTNTSIERIDSLTGCVFRYLKDTTANSEYMADSLFANPGDTIYTSRERMTTSGRFITFCVSIKSDSVFGIKSEIKKFYDESNIHGNIYALAKGFGILYMSGCELGCGLTSLVYAKIDGKEYGEKITSIISDENIAPNLFTLNQNYPNPFNPNTTINYQTPTTSFVSLKVYDVLGKEVAILVNEEKSAGNYKIDFDGSELASGIYFYTLQADNFVQNRKMILLK
jgi:hypothetical protein